MCSFSIFRSVAHQPSCFGPRSGPTPTPSRGGLDGSWKLARRGRAAPAPARAAGSASHFLPSAPTLCPADPIPRRAHTAPAPPLHCRLAQADEAHTHLSQAGACVCCCRPATVFEVLGGKTRDAPSFSPSRWTSAARAPLPQPPRPRQLQVVGETVAGPRPRPRPRPLPPRVGEAVAGPRPRPRPRPPPLPLPRAPRRRSFPPASAFPSPPPRVAPPRCR
jgi:hypothetical protein